MKPIVDSDHFPGSQKSTYLNAANVSLMYCGAAKAIIAWQNDVAENGSIHFDENAEATVFDTLHTAAARLFNVAPEDIAAGSNATELIGSLAWAIMPDSESNIVSTDVVFPSTIYPWMRVANHSGSEIRFAKGRNSYVNPDDIIRLIDESTAVVSISHVEYGNGQCYDLTQLSEATHAHDALLVVDATQSAGAIPIDAQEQGIDALICSGYKWLCGPFGAAVMYLSPALQSRLEPGLVGFRSHEKMWDLQANRIIYPNTAKRFEFSSMAYGCALGLASAIEYLLETGLELIYQYNLYLADLLIEGLKERTFEITSPCKDLQRSAIVTACIDGKNPAKLARQLKAAGIMVSHRKNTVRFSPHLYNRREDIEFALKRLDEIL